jgi:UDP-N-acetylglucosamine--N-acetylmuramyl-(pentapeptide) pyrophosphoryl-undecaprenol N-acetylglucosamine transferase
MIQRVIVAGGGTGGHLFPGIAVVDELRRRHPGLEVLYVGTARGIESRVIPQMNEKLETLDVSPLKGTTLLGRLQSLAKLPSAWGHAIAILRQHRPDVVLGVGGYASGPMLMAARSLGIPCALLEQNAHVGLTNRILSKLVGRAYVSFEETRATFGDAARVVGNPVRRTFVDAAKLALTDPEGFDSTTQRILVMGGSQGARTLNRVVPEAIAKLGVHTRSIEVVHQTGAAMKDEVEAQYRALGVNAKVVPFIDDVARAYTNASLVVCRAGASTLAELCAVGRASILIPYPFAADDHQTKNAKSLEASGAALTFADQSVDAETLANAMKRLFDDPAQRRAMSDAARRRGRPDAAASIVDDMEGWLDASASQGASTPGEGKREVGHPSAVENTVDVADDDSRSAPLLDVGEALQASATSPFGRVDFQSGRRMRMTRSVPALRVVPFEATLTLNSRPS